MLAFRSGSGFRDYVVRDSPEIPFVRWGEGQGTGQGTGHMRGREVGSSHCPSCCCPLFQQDRCPATSYPPPQPLSRTHSKLWALVARPVLQPELPGFGTSSSTWDLAPGPQGLFALGPCPHSTLRKSETLRAESGHSEASLSWDHPRAKACRPARMGSLVASAPICHSGPWPGSFRVCGLTPREGGLGGVGGAQAAGRGAGGKATDSRTNACNFITNLSGSMGGRLCLHSGPISLTEL